MRQPAVNLGAFGQALGALKDYNLAPADENDLGVLRDAAVLLGLLNATLSQDARKIVSAMRGARQGAARSQARGPVGRGAAYLDCGRAGDCLCAPQVAIRAPATSAHAPAPHRFPEMHRPRKILQRLPQPGLNRGRVQRAARRLFLLSDTVSTGDLRRAAYPRRRRVSSGNYASMHAVLAGMAVRVCRGGGQGRPLLWRLRNSGEKLEV